jgi:hypothetical protein
MATTLERASFAGQKGSTINLKLVSMTGYTTIGTAFTVGPITGVITNVMNYNTVKAQVTGGPASQPLLLPRGANVT